MQASVAVGLGPTILPDSKRGSSRGSTMAANNEESTGCQTEPEYGQVLQTWPCALVCSTLSQADKERAWTRLMAEHKTQRLMGALSSFTSEAQMGAQRSQETVRGFGKRHPRGWEEGYRLLALVGPLSMRGKGPSTHSLSCSFRVAQGANR